MSEGGMDRGGIMRGFPPPSEKTVTLENWRQPPFNRWAFQHVGELVPSAPIWRGAGPTLPLPRATQNLAAIPFRDHNGAQSSFGAFLDRHCSDGVCVLHRGRIVMEHYRNGFQAHRPHILMSVSKSFTALLAGILAERGLLNPAWPVARLVPEVANSAFADASLQHLLDMTADVDFDEDYLAPAGAIVAYREVSGWKPPSDPARPGDLRSWLAGLTGQGRHGRAFHYVSPCTDLLGWALERAATMPYAQLASELLWQPLGAEFDGYVTVDRLGAPRAAGGVCLALRDLARLGQAMLQEGQAHGRQLVPQAWVADSRHNGDKAAWAAGKEAEANPAGSYRNAWWIMGDEHGCYSGIGVYGQYLWIDPAASLVIARFASQPLPTDDATDADAARCFLAVGRALAG